MFELHSSMLLGDTGKAILTLAAAAYLIPHPNGLTSVWLHPASGSVLKVARWSELNLDHR